MSKGSETCWKRIMQQIVIPKYYYTKPILLDVFAIYSVCFISLENLVGDCQEKVKLIKSD